LLRALPQPLDLYQKSRFLSSRESLWYEPGPYRRQLHIVTIRPKIPTGLLWRGDLALLLGVKHDRLEQQYHHMILSEDESPGS
jgi:hypothetical protein